MEDTSLQQPFDNNPSYPAPKAKKKAKRLILIVFLFILVVFGIFGGKSFIGSDNKKKETLIITPSPIEEVEFPIDTPIPTESESMELTDTPTPKPTVDPIDKATGIDRSELSVEVQNGSGEKLVASKGSEVLKILGYNVIAAKNADNSDYENVTIKVKNDKSKFLDLLKKDLGFSYTVGSSSADLDSSSTADAVVIIGK